MALSCRIPQISAIFDEAEAHHQQALTNPLAIDTAKLAYCWHWLTSQLPKEKYCYG